MTPQIAVGLASLLGAVFFLLGGFFIGRRQTVSGPVQDLDDELGSPSVSSVPDTDAAGGWNLETATDIQQIPEPRDDAEAAKLSAQLQAKEREIGQARQRIGQVEEKLRLLTVERDEWKDKASELQSQAGGDFEEKTKVNSSAMELVRIEQELAKAQEAHKEAVASKEKLAGELKARDREIEQLKQRQTELASEGRGAQANADEAAKLEQDIADYKNQLAAANAKLEQLNKLEEERYELKEEIKTLKAEIQEQSKLKDVADEKHQLAMQMESLKQKAQEADSLRDEKARLGDEIANVKKELQEANERLGELDAIEKERKDLSIKVEMLEQQKQEIEQLRDENRGLKDKAAEIEVYEQEIAELNEQLASLRSKGLVASVAPRPVLTSTKEGTGAALQNVLNTIAQDKASRGAVVADEQGLLVAGMSDHAEAMAALSATLHDVGQRVRKALPFGAIKRMTVVDDNSLTLSALPFQSTSGGLMMATLSAGPGPDDSVVSKLIGEIAEAAAAEGKNVPSSAGKPAERSAGAGTKTAPRPTSGATPATPASGSPKAGGAGAASGAKAPQGAPTPPRGAPKPPAGKAGEGK